MKLYTSPVPSDLLASSVMCSRRYLFADYVFDIVLLVAMISSNLQANIS